MTRTNWYIGNALAGYLDFCMGVLIAAACATLMGQTPTLLLLLWGALFALLPDIDLLWPILRGRVRRDYNHRFSPMHMPPLVLGLVFAVLLCAFGPSSVWTIVALLGLLWHYAHDMPEGLVWFPPFTHLSTGVPRPVDHDKWLERTWCSFSLRGMSEVAGGTLLLVVPFMLTSGLTQAAIMAVGTITFVTAFMFWSLVANDRVVQ